jgi:transposase-like protein
VGERRYPTAVRAEMVRLARAGRRIADLAAEYGPSPSMIRAWVRADRASLPIPADPPAWPPPT